MAVGVLVILMLPTIGGTVPVTAATPPLPGGNPRAVSKPADLPFRLPWKNGESHVLGAFRYNGLNASGATLGDHLCAPGNNTQDCYALDVIDDSPAYPLTRSTVIYPLFPGHVVFAGCAAGGSSHTWERYGKVVYIETVRDGHVYGALYAHLSSLTPPGAKHAVRTGDDVSASQPIGKAGDTETVNGSCNATDPSHPYAVHLHFAVYRFPRTTVHPASWWLGAPYGGQPVVPEPLIGAGVYENFAWWNDGTSSGRSPAMKAENLTRPPRGVVPKPQSKWTATTLNQSQIGPKKKIVYQAQVSDTVPIKQVQFTAYYPDWSVVAPSGFDSQKVWRIVAVCRPPGSSGIPASDPRCTWTGGTTNATVTFTFDPSKAGGTSGLDWLPPASTPRGTHCVPVTMSVDVYDSAGVQKLGPSQFHVVNSCSSASHSVTKVGSAAASASNPHVVRLSASPASLWPYLTEYGITHHVDYYDSIIKGAAGSMWFTEAGGIGRMDSSGALAEFPIANERFVGLVLGPDGNVWFANGPSIGRVTPAGRITTYAPPSGASALTVGPDGNLWYYSENIGRVTPSGSITEFAVPHGDSSDMAIGSDGNLWFTERNDQQDRIGRITTAGVVTEFDLPEAGSDPYSIVSGPDGALWFDEPLVSKIGRITTTGNVTEYQTPTSSSFPSHLTIGPDGKMWFVEEWGNRIAHVEPDHTIVESPALTSVPTSPVRSSSFPMLLASAADGNLWFVEEFGTHRLGRITPSNSVLELPNPSSSFAPAEDGGMSVGPDGDLWFVEYGSQGIAKIDVAAVP